MFIQAYFGTRFFIKSSLIFIFFATSLALTSSILIGDTSFIKAAEIDQRIRKIEEAHAKYELILSEYSKNFGHPVLVAEVKRINAVQINMLTTQNDLLDRVTYRDGLFAGLSATVIALQLIFAILAIFGYKKITHIKEIKNG